MSSRKLIAVYHPGTGRIKQVNICFEQDQDKQHGCFPDHHWREVPPGTHPNRHQIDIATGAVVPKVLTLDEAKDKASRVASMKCEQVIHEALHGQGDFVALRTAALAGHAVAQAAIAATTDIAALAA